MTCEQKQVEEEKKDDAEEGMKIDQGSSEKDDQDVDISGIFVKRTFTDLGFINKELYLYPQVL